MFSISQADDMQPMSTGVNPMTWAISATVRLASWLSEQIRTCKEQKDTHRATRAQPAGNERTGRDAVLKADCVFPLSIVAGFLMGTYHGCQSPLTWTGRCTTSLFYGLYLNRQLNNTFH